MGSNSGKDDIIANIYLSHLWNYSFQIASTEAFKLLRHHQSLFLYVIVPAVMTSERDKRIGLGSILKKHSSSNFTDIEGLT